MPRRSSWVNKQTNMTHILYRNHVVELYRFAHFFEFPLGNSLIIERSVVVRTIQSDLRSLPAVIGGLF